MLLYPRKIVQLLVAFTAMYLLDVAATNVKLNKEYILNDMTYSSISSFCSSADVNYEVHILKAP